MKQSKFRKDNMGVVVGRLSAPNTIQYEADGRIASAQLSGNILETEYNDVFILGTQLSEDEVRVDKMESIPLATDNYLGFMSTGEQGPIYCLAIPKNMIKAVEKRVSEKTDATYHALSVELNKNDHMYFNVFGAFEQDIRTGSYIFVVQEAPRISKKTVGTGYATITKTTRTAAGWQVIS